MSIPLKLSHHHHLNPPGWPLLCEDESMLSTKDIIRAIWDAQGYGNLAVWVDGTTRVIEPGQVPIKDGQAPCAVFKPLPLVGGFPMLDNALYDSRLQDTIEEVIRSSGGEITRE